MDLLLMSDEIGDPWQSGGEGLRMTAKRKHWSQETNNSKMRKSNGGNEVNSWETVEELAVDLDSACSLTGFNVDLSSGFSNSDALLALPSLSNFKQELLSPFCGSDANADIIPQNGNHQKSSPAQYENGTNKDPLTSGYQSSESSPVHDENNSSSSLPGLNKISSGNSPSANVVTSAPATSSTVSPAAEDCRFQYVLAAATSIATKLNEETLTYLNQGQPYEIKLKKLGDLSEYRGKILKSVVRLSFHERRLQYMEREQMAAWVSSHPGSSILEVDLPLSYGIFDLAPETGVLNSVEFLWDPTKEVGVYVKVNCISTEFTAKKHGGEKGVPFRIQVDTYLQNDPQMRRLHSASCQVKVFKLKGADRKHKQDREKILKRPLAEQEKFQCSYDCTVLIDTPVNNDTVYPKIEPNLPSPPSITISEEKKYRQLASVSSSVPLDDQQRRNNLEAAPDSPILQKPIVTDEGIVNGFEGTVNSGWGPQQLAVWLQANRYGPHIHTLSTYSGADLLRLTENNLVQLCGLPDGIRLYNVLHSRPIAPKLTLYICVDPRDRVYQAVHLTCLTSTELLTKVSSVLGIHVTQVASVFVEGPNGIKLVLNDQLVSHLNDHSAYSISSVQDGANRFELLLKPSEHNPNA
ncbi:Transcription factor [Nesidiocoris tenuis]|uniref:Transcription factor n=1 Tax=Nesidiocoris tenuis TaxID=355587 RepID=A0ABN7BI48_9HEMI|nr:Transcription factor [Nesidiocoris tenuis]